jgi:hypothetical protein
VVVVLAQSEIEVTTAKIQFSLLLRPPVVEGVEQMVERHKQVVLVEVVVLTNPVQLVLLDKEIVEVTLVEVPPVVVEEELVRVVKTAMLPLIQVLVVMVFNLLLTEHQHFMQPVEMVLELVVIQMGLAHEVPAVTVKMYLV